MGSSSGQYSLHQSVTVRPSIGPKTPWPAQGAGHVDCENGWTECGTVSALKCLSAAALLGRPRRGWSDDPVELGLRPGRTMDRGMSDNIELQPLDVVVEHDRVVADIGRRR